MMPDLPRLFYPCRYAYRGARETPHSAMRRHQKAFLIRIGETVWLRLTQ
jgi:hypothetical protein